MHSMWFKERGLSLVHGLGIYNMLLRHVSEAQESSDMYGAIVSILVLLPCTAPDLTSLGLKTCAEVEKSSRLSYRVLEIQSL